MLKSLSIIRYIDYADDIDMPFFLKQMQTTQNH